MTEPHAGIIGNVIINNNNMLDMTAIDPTESQKAVADILNDNQNYIDLFSSVNQLLAKRKTIRPISGANVNIQLQMASI